MRYRFVNSDGNLAVVFPTALTITYAREAISSLLYDLPTVASYGQLKGKVAMLLDRNTFEFEPLCRLMSSLWPFDNTLPGTPDNDDPQPLADEVLDLLDGWNREARLLAPPVPLPHLTEDDLIYWVGVWGCAVDRHCIVALARHLAKLRFDPTTLESLSTHAYAVLPMSDWPSTNALTETLAKFVCPTVDLPADVTGNAEYLTLGFEVVPMLSAWVQEVRFALPTGVRAGIDIGTSGAFLDLVQLGADRPTCISREHAVQVLRRVRDGTLGSAIRELRTACEGMGLYEAKLFVDALWLGLGKTDVPANVVVTDRAREAVRTLAQQVLEEDDPASFRITLEAGDGTGEMYLVVRRGAIEVRVQREHVQQAMQRIIDGRKVQAVRDLRSELGCDLTTGKLVCDVLRIHGDIGDTPTNVAAHTISQAARCWIESQAARAQENRDYWDYAYFSLDSVGVSRLRVALGLSMGGAQTSWFEVSDSQVVEIARLILRSDLEFGRALDQACDVLRNIPDKAIPSFFHWLTAHLNPDALPRDGWEGANYCGCDQSVVDYVKDLCSDLLSQEAEDPETPEEPAQGYEPYSFVAKEGGGLIEVETGTHIPRELLRKLVGFVEAAVRHGSNSEVLQVFSQVAREMPEVPVGVVRALVDFLSEMVRAPRPGYDATHFARAEVRGILEGGSCE